MANKKQFMCLECGHVAVSPRNLEGDTCECGYGLFGPAAPLARVLRAPQEDTPCLEDGRDNCNDHGTGEGQWHGRM